MSYAIHALKITKFIIVCLLILTFSASSKNLHADELTDDLKSGLSFLGGVVSAYAVHEAGHLVTAMATGTEMTWQTGTYNQPLGFTEDAKSDDKGFAINAVGLLFQNATGEYVLRSDRFNKNSKFVQGIMAWNIINPVIYSLDYWFIKQSNQERKDGYQGDIKGVEYYSSKDVANGYALSVTAIALSQGYRFMKSQSWLQVDAFDSLGNFMITPAKSGGIMWSYTVQF